MSKTIEVKKLDKKLSQLEEKIRQRKKQYYKENNVALNPQAINELRKMQEEITELQKNIHEEQ